MCYYFINFCLLLSKQQTFRLTFSEIRSCALHSEILLSDAKCFAYLIILFGHMTLDHCYKYWGSINEKLFWDPFT